MKIYCFLKGWNKRIFGKNSLHIHRNGKLNCSETLNYSFIPKIIYAVFMLYCQGMILMMAIAKNTRWSMKQVMSEVLTPWTVEDLWDLCLQSLNITTLILRPKTHASVYLWMTVLIKQLKFWLVICTSHRNTYTFMTVHMYPWLGK